MFALPFPAIDPVLISFGPIAVRWYGLAYLAGIIIGWRVMRRLATHAPYGLKAETVDDFLVWAVCGVIVGGRVGYVLFYNLGFFLSNPAEIFAIWQGGMSFHGGFLGVVVAGWLFCRRREIQPLAFGDLLAVVTPIGLFFGRIANFINGELFGRTSDVPWAVVFPHGGPLPRHPSQLYEAALEGVVLFVVLSLMWRNESIRNRPGVLTGTFIAGYALARMVVELFRQPDAHIGFLTLGSTMGQWLSVPMLLVGLGLVLRGWRKA